MKEPDEVAAEPLSAPESRPPENAPGLGFVLFFLATVAAAFNRRRSA